MFKKLTRTKVFRDPLYGYIKVDYELIAKVIDTAEVQRLRRIRQLSGVSMVFQTAEHTRFTHALGAYQMANLVIENVSGAEAMEEYERIVFLCAALLHDVGHGPYSHAFESVMKISHEEMTAKLILSPESEVNQVLETIPTLAEDIAGVILHKGKFPLIESLVSSQLDVDRMDYLCRDAYFTGATYGVIDRERLLRSMVIKNHKVYVKASGVHSVESYIMNRYHMYWQVYFHPTARAYDLILESLYRRIKYLTEQSIAIEAEVSSLLNVMGDDVNIKEYINLDDAYVNGFVKQLIHSKDYVLSTLSKAFMNRRLFKYVDLNTETDGEEIAMIKEKYSTGIYKDYFYHEVSIVSSAYLESNHNVQVDINEVRILTPSGDTMPLEEYSPIIKGLISSSLKKSVRIFYYEDTV